MKISIFRYLLALVCAIIVIAPTYALDNDKRPKKRRQLKEYTSPEEIEAKEDSIRMLRGEEIVEAIEVAVENLSEPRQNTPQQIDSLLAMWRTTTTKASYERYFDEFLNVTEAIDPKSDSADSLYIARLNALMSPVPMHYNHEVRTAIERFSSAGYAEKMSYAYHYFPMIEEELINAGLPVELRAMVIIESGLNPLATSKAGAKGLWQFMPRTGKEYGLEINSMVDERCNPLLATRAACKYLKNMYDMYGDWTLAIASYNCGPGNVNKAITRSGGNRESYKGDFWDIYYNLPRETRSYVPLFMGATYAFAYHKAHGVEYTTPPMPLAVDTVMINRPLHLEQVSSTIDVDLELLKMLNPQYTLQIIPATTKSYTLTLPTERLTDFIANEEAIHAKDSIYLKEYLVPENIEKKKSTPPPAKYHTVKKGETLGAIARRYGKTVKQLMNWNGIRNANTLRIGQRIRVSAN
ncbi:MAG: LysM peptidoglycan-binding domain-containing protein [Rikenellaceae bacterium]|nr:LysM peptidoglycan-binding domain-containing protein [Rikenellaceae bacterium]